MTINDIVDVFINTVIALAYATSEGTSANSVAIEDGEIEDSDRRSTDNIKTGAKPTSASNPAVDHMAVTRNQ